VERKVVIVGHVDHGKSTLIGRLLYDTGSLPASGVDELESLAAGRGGELEFAFLLDHLKEERDEGITIDTAQARVKSDGEHFVIIDAPGHREFLKNMLTGATQANAALLVVDVREGLKEQTRRHAHMLSLVGVLDLVVCVNKLDAVGWSRERFQAVGDELTAFLRRLDVTPRAVIPVSAKHGDNLASRSARIGWYRGPCVLEALKAVEPGARLLTGPVRFPIQDAYVRGEKQIFVGRVEAGLLRPGDPLVILPSGEGVVVRSIEVFGAKATAGVVGQSIGITVDQPERIGRGDVVAGAAHPPTVSRTVPARIFSISKADLRARQAVTLKLATQEVPAILAKISRRIDSATLETKEEGGSAVEETDVAEVEIEAERPVVFDRYAEVPEMGRFVLVEGRETLAGGLVTA
jgi:small GTP-binding protein